jgi:hypothetical protein
LVVDRIEWDGFGEGHQHGGRDERIVDTAVRNGNTGTDPGTAHFFPRQQTLKQHLTGGAQALCGQFTDDLEGAFLAGTRDRTLGAVPTQYVFKLHSYF